jgi:hypothetical protein
MYLTQNLMHLILLTEDSLKNFNCSFCLKGYDNQIRKDMNLSH